MCAGFSDEMTTHNPKLLQQLERERADRLALRLTLQQLDAIAKDTRLPGEIAGTYGVTAAVILEMPVPGIFAETAVTAVPTP